MHTNTAMVNDRKYFQIYDKNHVKSLKWLCDIELV